MNTLIDSSTGQFCISKSTTIGYNASSVQILNVLPKEYSRDLSFGNGWSWIRCDKISIHEQEYTLGFSLFNHKLRAIHVQFYDHLKYLQEHMEDLTEENELKRKEEYNSWLSSQIGDQREFSWGQIEACYHPKDGISLIVLRYNVI